MTRAAFIRRLETTRDQLGVEAGGLEALAGQLRAVSARCAELATRLNPLIDNHTAEAYSAFETAVDEFTARAARLEKLLKRTPLK